MRWIPKSKVFTAEDESFIAESSLESQDDPTDETCCLSLPGEKSALCEPTERLAALRKKILLLFQILLIKPNLNLEMTIVLMISSNFFDNNFKFGKWFFDFLGLRILRIQIVLIIQILVNDEPLIETQISDHPNPNIKNLTVTAKR